MKALDICTDDNEYRLNQSAGEQSDSLLTYKFSVATEQPKDGPWDAQVRASLLSKAISELYDDINQGKQYFLRSHPYIKDITLLKQDANAAPILSVQMVSERDLDNVRDLLRDVIKAKLFEVELDHVRQHENHDELSSLGHTHVDRLSGQFRGSTSGVVSHTTSNIFREAVLKKVWAFVPDPEAAEALTDALIEIFQIHSNEMRSPSRN